MESACPLCADGRRFANPKKRKTLYGHPVCKKCCYAFANRRQLAYFIDCGFAYLAGGLAMLGLAKLLVAVNLGSGAHFVIVTTAFYVVFFSVLFLRDAFGGRSIGKAVCGVRTIREKSGATCGVKGSIVRALPLLIPIVPLIVAFQLQKGYRWGDRWAGTRVVWRKHAGSPVFSTAAELGKVFE